MHADGGEGTVVPGTILTEKAVRRQFDLSKYQFDRLVDSGLPIARLGHLRVVAGNDIIEFFERLKKEQAGTSSDDNT